MLGHSIGTEVAGAPRGDGAGIGSLGMNRHRHFPLCRYMKDKLKGQTEV
jgi:hypothetical protein